MTRHQLYKTLVLMTSIRLTLRMWPDPQTDAAWKQSVKDINGELLCVSQFTLMANTVKGNKPDYHSAMVIYDILSFFGYM